MSHQESYSRWSIVDPVENEDFSHSFKMFQYVNKLFDDDIETVIFEYEINGRSYEEKVSQDEIMAMIVLGGKRTGGNMDNMHPVALGHYKMPLSHINRACTLFEIGKGKPFHKTARAMGSIAKEYECDFSKYYITEDKEYTQFLRDNSVVTNAYIGLVTPKNNILDSYELPSLQQKDYMKHALFNNDVVASLNNDVATTLSSSEVEMMETWERVWSH